MCRACSVDHQLPTVGSMLEPSSSKTILQNTQARMMVPSQVLIKFAKRLDQLPLIDYVQRTDEEWLKKLEVEAVRIEYLRDLLTNASNNNNNINNQEPRNEEEERIRRTIDNMKRQGVWPIRHSVAKKNCNEPCVEMYSAF